MSATSDDAPMFIATPMGDELVIMTRNHYDRLARASRASSDDAATAEDEADAATTRDSRDAWIAAGKPSAPLAVIRRVRAGDSWLKAFRGYRGLTQSALAKQAGLGQGYLSEIETSRKTPSPDARTALAKVLDIHPLFLSDDAPAAGEPTQA